MDESSSFEIMIQRGFCPQYRHVSRRTTTRDIIELYQRKLSSLKENFLKVTFSFALTSDMWTSSHQMAVVLAEALLRVMAIILFSFLKS